MPQSQHKWETKQYTPVSTIKPTLTNIFTVVTQADEVFDQALLGHEKMLLLAQSIQMCVDKSTLRRPERTQNMLISR